MADYDWLDERRKLVDWLLSYLKDKEKEYKKTLNHS
jgi:hypothetical protein